jgi:hypothetical protein
LGSDPSHGGKAALEERRPVDVVVLRTGEDEIVCYQRLSGVAVLSEGNVAGAYRFLHRYRVNTPDAL